MSYSVKPILLAYSNKEGQRAVVIQVIHNGIKLYPPTEVRIKEDQWREATKKTAAAVINHPLKEKYNDIILKKKIEVEGRLLEAKKHKSSFTKEQLELIIFGKAKQPEKSMRFEEFTYQLIDELKGKLSPGRIRHYEVIINKILDFDPETNLSDVDGSWLQRFENHLRELGNVNSTINSNISIIKKVIRSAKAKKLIPAIEFEGYQRPKNNSDDPVYLTENELQDFIAVVKSIKHPAKKLAGYYFMLSCYTGFRISDAQKFNYETVVQGDEIIIRATKNKKVVTIPVYSELSEVLDYIHDKPLHFTQKTLRDHVREISALAGIKKNVKYHSSRHTAVSRFLRKGLSLPEVSEIIGDTESVTKIYAHIEKEYLRDKMKRLLG